MLIIGIICCDNDKIKTFANERRHIKATWNEIQDDKEAKLIVNF